MSKFVEPNIAQVLTTEVPEGVHLFTIEDINKLKAEIANEEGYKLLKDDTKVGYKLWVKTNGEGSGNYDPNDQYDSIEAAKSPFLRHKYTCELPFSVQVFYDLSRDYKRRYEWDHRDTGRRIVKIIHTPNEPNGMKYQVIEQMVKSVGGMMSDRECITLTAEYWENDSCYWLSKSLDFDTADKLVGQTRHVRSNVLFLGMVMQPINDGKHMKYWCVTQLDPKGWIPSSIQNWATRFIPGAFKREVTHAAELRMNRDASANEYINYYNPPSQNSNEVKPESTTVEITTEAKQENVQKEPAQETKEQEQEAKETVQETKEQEQGITEPKQESKELTQETEKQEAKEPEQEVKEPVQNTEKQEQETKEQEQEVKEAVQETKEQEVKEPEQETKEQEQEIKEPEQETKEPAQETEKQEIKEQEAKATAREIEKQEQEPETNEPDQETKEQDSIESLPAKEEKQEKNEEEEKETQANAE